MQKSESDSELLLVTRPNDSSGPEGNNSYFLSFMGANTRFSKFKKPAFFNFTAAK